MATVTRKLLIAQNNRTEEALFSRMDDELIAREEATREMFEEMVSLTIDGETLKVPKAVPATDFLGNVVYDASGKPKPRSTTIYDAARQLVKEGRWTEEELTKRIPLLCHREHLDPIAVCRMCSVHVCKYSKRSKKITPARVLAPACQHDVQEDMIVTTRGGKNDTYKESAGYAETVEKSVKVLAEMLTADHIHPDAERDNRFVNELENVAKELAVDTPRARLQKPVDRNTPRGVKSRPLPMITVDELPYSSRSIIVDHDRCILCDRCVRSCSDVKPFKVIGHTGKGYTTRISFDLDLIQEESNCVQCGECMTACPTGALTLKRRVAPRAFEEAEPIPQDPTKPLPAEFLSAQEMMEVELDYTDSDGVARKFRPFASIPFAYLKWNEGAVRRRVVSEGDVLCYEGQFGSTAFLLKRGRFEIWSRKATISATSTYSFRSLLGGASKEKKLGAKVNTVGSDALILGELACLSARPRTASIVAAGVGEVFEITRNLLDMAQRSPTARDVLNALYRRNAVRTSVRDVKLFRKLNSDQRLAAAGFLDSEGKAEFKRVEPGQAVVLEGDPANDFYIIRKGFLKATRTVNGVEQVLSHMGENDYFGEIALLAKEPRVSLFWKGDPDNPRRSASVIALDPVELIRIPGDDFRELCTFFPDVLDIIVEECNKRLKADQNLAQVENDHLPEYLKQGLFQGQKLLVLDLDSCTRCDECTRACADSHGGVNRLFEGGSVSRLLREGQRFGDFLVATSCRSCHKPYCMDGCPVDAIHRDGDKLEVIIDNHCIGCGLCESNCPYGAIQMVPKVPGHSERGMTAKRQAVNCDLCHDLVPEGAETFCVAACPHEAAFRISGPELLKEVTARSAV